MRCTLLSSASRLGLRCSSPGWCGSAPAPTPSTMAPPPAPPPRPPSTPGDGRGETTPVTTVAPRLPPPSSSKLVGSCTASGGSGVRRSASMASARRSSSSGSAAFMTLMVLASRSAHWSARRGQGRMCSSGGDTQMLHKGGVQREAGRRRGRAGGASLCCTDHLSVAGRMQFALGSMQSTACALTTYLRPRRRPPPRRQTR